VSHSLNAKYAFAYGINLQSQLATAQLEDRQIIRRSLDRHFPFGRPLFPFAIPWTTLVSQDGLAVKRRTAAVNQRLKDLLHGSAHFENQIPKRMDETVEQNPVKAAISESNAILGMLVEGVHGKLLCCEIPGA
jgi:hypothetical protein